MEEFKPSTWTQPVQDIVKEFEKKDAEDSAPEDVPTKPEEFSKSMVRRGVIQRRTGLPTGNSKQGHNLMSNIKGFSPKGQDNYERTFGHK